VSAKPRGRGRWLAALVVLWLSGSAAGESAAPSSQPALRAGVSDAPPFAIHNADGSWSGIAVDLWREVAGALGRTFAFEHREPAQLLQGLGDGSLDVVVGPVAITPAHAALADFTHAYLSTTLSIAVRPNAVPSWRRILSVVFAPRLVHVLVSLALVTVLLGVLVWLLERGENREHFERPSRRGVWSAIWWAAATVSTVGYGDKTPRTVAGRLVAMLGMLIGILLVSVLTATFASEITLGHLRATIRGPHDLRRVAVGAVSGSAAEDWLNYHAIPTHAYTEVAEALAALERHEVDAVVSHDIVLRYWTTTKLRGHIEVLPAGLAPEFLAFALPTGSDSLGPMNLALLRTTHGDRWKHLLQSYLRSP
jgi:ABC-type amino acid transport substrate-binding protein